MGKCCCQKETLRGRTKRKLQPFPSRKFPLISPDHSTIISTAHLTRLRHISENCFCSSHIAEVLKKKRKGKKKGMIVALHATQIVTSIKVGGFWSK